MNSEDPSGSRTYIDAESQPDSRFGNSAIDLGVKRENEAIGRDLGKIFSQALKIYLDNPLIIVPSLIPIAALFLGLTILASYVGLIAIFSHHSFLEFSFLASILLFGIIILVLIFLAEGASIDMIRQASMGNAADLSNAWKSIQHKLEPLVLTSILAGIAIALGYALFFIPGLIMSFAFYFIAQVVMIDGKSGLEALKESYRFAEANLSDSLIVVLASLTIRAVLHSVPIIGPLLWLVSLPYIYALATLLYIDRSRMHESSIKKQRKEAKDGGDLLKPQMG